MVSPRRIAVLIKDVPGEQAPREIVQRGPAFEAAFDAEGKPTKACEGFARAKGSRPTKTWQAREEAGRRFVYYVTQSESRPTAGLLPDICLKIVRDMYFPKNMRWGYRDVRFSRPIRWLVALWGETVIPFGIAGLDPRADEPGAPLAGRRRWRSLVRPTTWRPCGRWPWWSTTPSGSRSCGRARTTGPARKAWRSSIPNGKMEEVLFLVEWPTVAEGQFEGQHLGLPAEVLETAMQSHQRYFPLVDKDGTLSNRFLYVTNGDPAWLDQITAGNERVLEGRIEDAEFSFDKDKATGLEAMASQLGKIVFHVKAGSMKDKTERLVALTGYLAEVTGAPGEARERALEAARLAKADQVSIMVREFADLEGVMGETYARMEGHHPEVAQAIREQFLPDAAGGAVPATFPGAFLATAEKVGQHRRRLRLRRTPLGLQRTPTVCGGRRRAWWPSPCSTGCTTTWRSCSAGPTTSWSAFPVWWSARRVMPEATAFVLERLAKTLTDDGLARDTVDAVLPTSRDFLDLRAARPGAARVPRRRRLGRPGDRVHPAVQPGQEAPGRGGRRGGAWPTAGYRRPAVPGRRRGGAVRRLAGGGRQGRAGGRSETGTATPSLRSRRCARPWTATSTTCWSWPRTRPCGSTGCVNWPRIAATVRGVAWSGAGPGLRLERHQTPTGQKHQDWRE